MISSIIKMNVAKDYESIESEWVMYYSFAVIK